MLFKLYVCIYTYVYVCTYMSMYVYVYECIYVNAYVYWQSVS